MKRASIAIGFVAAVGPGLHRATTGWSEPMPEPGDDVERTVATAIDELRRSADSDRALDHIYSVIASEAVTRSGRVDTLRLQSAALRIRRGDVDTAPAYLDLALGFDGHASTHDLRAPVVPVSGAPFMPTWPLTMAAGVLAVGIGFVLGGRGRSRDPFS